MANEVSDGAGDIASKAGGATGIPLGGVTGTLQGGVNKFIKIGSGILDKWFPPEKREEFKNKLTKFATERPKLAAFLLSQIALSGIPLALFIIMSIVVFVFALLVGIIVGVLGAVIFTVSCLGLALIVLLPTLFVTTFAATFIFLWGVGAYYIVKWFNKKEVPGIHEGGGDKLKKQLGLDSVPSMNGEAAPPQAPAEQQQQQQNTNANTNANGEDESTDGESEQERENSKPPPVAKKSQTPSGKEIGAEHGPNGDVKKTVQD